MTSFGGIADVDVKSDLFKEVKYYVTGTIEPQASISLFSFSIYSIKVIVLIK